MDTALPRLAPMPSTPRTPLLATWAHTGARRVGVVLGGSLVLALSAWAQVPLHPIPMTLQSLAAVLLGALCGPRLAAAAALTYLAEGAAGLPVWAGGAAGALHLLGPSGGYLFGCVAAAALCGHLAARSTSGACGHALHMLFGHAVILAAGGSWLAAFIGPAAALRLGVLPFVVGSALKVAAGACLATGLTPPRRPGRTVSVCRPG